MKSFFVAITVVTILISGLNSCGGELHFVSPLLVGSPPPPKKTEPVVERFRYAVPSGSVHVSFVFYPLKTMMDVVDDSKKAVWPFLETFFSPAQSYDDVHFSLVLDSETASQVAFHPKKEGVPRPLWPEKSRVFLENGLGWIRSKLDKDGPESRTPVKTLTKVTDGMGFFSPDITAPQWAYFVYLRNRELFPSVEEELNFANDRLEFLAALTFPLSPFRYEIVGLSHLKDGAPCFPSSFKVGVNLNRMLSHYVFRGFELCRFDGGTLREMAKEMFAKSSRIILSRSPQMDTLEFWVRGKSWPRDLIRYDEGNNEIHVTEPAALELKPGEFIEVRYVPREA